MRKAIVSGKIKITMHAPGYARVRAFGLPPERFREFRAAAEGASYVRELRQKLTPIDKLPGILVRLRKAGFNVEAAADVRKTLQERDAKDWIASEELKERIARIDDELYKRLGCRLYPFQVTGSHWLARKHGALLADDMGLGKEQPVSEPVLTPAGWRPIGDLKVGDFVIGRSGCRTRVVGVYPQGERDVYEVKLTDGATTRCGLEHLWQVQTTNDRARGNVSRVLSLSEILDDGLRSPSGNSKCYVPIPDPVSFGVRSDIDFAPYLLGALIANGSFLDTPAHSGSDAQRALIAPYLAEMSMELRAADPVTSRIVKVGVRSSRTNPLKQWLKQNGLWSKRSWEKSIPERFLFADPMQRRSLLAGLLDNDGTVDARHGTIEYNTTSPELARQVLHLVRSLGGSAWMSTRTPKYTYLGETLEGRLDHRIRMAITFNPFELYAKAVRYKPRTKYPPSRAIESVRRVGREESVCIRVDAPDHLYVTNDFIVTHNTAQLIAAIPEGAAVLVVAPAVAKGDWRAQVRRWRPRLRCEVLKGRKSFRWPEPGEILITNYDILPKVHDEAGVTGRVCHGKLPPKPCPGCAERIVFSGRIATVIRTGHKLKCTGELEPEDCPGCHPLLKQAPRGIVIIGDEAHSLKNGRSIRTQRFRALSESARRIDGRIWLATGTPLENEPKELWAVFKAAGIAEEAFGSFDRFLALFDGIKTDHGFVWGTPSPDLKEHLQRVMLRRLKLDVLPQLPTKTWGNYEVEIDTKTLRTIDEFLRRSKRSVAEIAELVEMREIGFEFMSSIRSALASAKIPAMLEIVEDFEERDVPLIVFSAHRAPIDVLSERPGWLIITGDESGERKTQAADQFQHGAYAPDASKPDESKPGKIIEHMKRRVDAEGRVVYPKGIAITISSGGVALTLTRACNELFVDRAWKPTANAQAEDRAVRIGQTRNTVVMTLVANHPLDERVTEILVKKTRMISASIDAAADGRDAPLLTEAELEKTLREVQEAIACGKAVRRIARTDEERAALEALHTLAFKKRSDERIASELAEEAVSVGLSDAQWELAIRLVARQEACESPESTNTSDESTALPDKTLPAAPVVTQTPAPAKASPPPRTSATQRARWGMRRGARRL